MQWKEDELNWLEKWRDRIENYENNMDFLADTFVPSPRVLLLCHYLVFGSKGIQLIIKGTFVELRLRYSRDSLSRVLFRESMGGLSYRTVDNFRTVIINDLTYNGVPKDIAQDIGKNSDLYEAV